MHVFFLTFALSSISYLIIDNPYVGIPISIAFGLGVYEGRSHKKD